MSGHQVAACENSPRRTYTPDFAPRSLGTPTAGSRLPGSRAACDRPYLGLHQPAGDGGLPIVAWPELQGHGAGADVGDAQVRGGPWEFCRRKTGQGERWPEKDVLPHGTDLSGRRGRCAALSPETSGGQHDVASPRRHRPRPVPLAHRIHSRGQRQG